MSSWFLVNLCSKITKFFHSFIYIYDVPVYKHSGRIPRNACVPDAWLHSYACLPRKCYYRTNTWTDRQTDTGQSELASDTKMDVSCWAFRLHFLPVSVCTVPHPPLHSSRPVSVSPRTVCCLYLNLFVELPVALSIHYGSLQFPLELFVVFLQPHHLHLQPENNTIHCNTNDWKNHISSTKHITHFELSSYCKPCFGCRILFLDSYIKNWYTAFYIARKLFLYLILCVKGKTEVPRDVRNSKVRKQDKFRRDWSQH